jgi:type I restriction enzyme S subunit
VSSGSRSTDLREAWFGEVSPAWTLARTKNAIRVVSDKVGDGWGDHDLLSLTLRGVIPRDMESGKGKFPESFDTYQTVKKGDLVFCLFDIDETPRTVGLSRFDGMITGAYTVARCTERADPRYVYYFYLSIDERKGLRPFYTGLRKVVRADTFLNATFPLPDLPTQRQIADFLDRETARIDLLIEKKQRLVELLGEKEESAVAKVVTRGLDSLSAVRKSGTAWFRDIPEHWEIRRLRFLVRGIKAGPFGSALTKDMYSSSEFRVYGQEQVIPGDFSIGDYFISAEQYARMFGYRVEAGDVLVSCVGTFGKIAVFPADAAPGIINPRLIRIRPSKIVVPEYLESVLKSRVVYEQMASISRGGTMDVINIGILSDLILPIPPVDEQQRILEDLNGLTASIRKTVVATNGSISRLKEYRSALITAAVTGQIDVTTYGKAGSTDRRLDAIQEEMEA